MALAAAAAAVGGQDLRDDARISRMRSVDDNGELLEAQLEDMLRFASIK